MKIKIAKAVWKVRRIIVRGLRKIDRQFTKGLRKLTPQDLDRISNPPLY